MRKNSFSKSVAARTVIAGAIAASASLAATATTASADVIYATSVESYTPGLQKNGQQVELARRDPTKALGAPINNDTMNFVSLGFGGELTLGFDQPFAPISVTVTETTWGTIGNHLERADIFVGYHDVDNILQWLFAGSVMNTHDNTPIDISHLANTAPAFTLVRIVDTTPGLPTTSSYDGFDVDGVAVIAAPVPAPGAAALAALGMIAAAPRRRRSYNT